MTLHTFCDFLPKLEAVCGSRDLMLVVRMVWLRHHLNTVGSPNDANPGV